MKSFKQWTEENHPEDEMMQEIFAGLAKKAGSFAKKAVSAGVDVANRTRVGMKRAGQVVDKVLGDDPYDRQKQNRQRTKDREEFSKIAARIAED